MDWAEGGKGNRNPVVIIDGDAPRSILARKPEPGTKVTLDASGSSDPDGDKLRFHWWVLSAAGTHDKPVEIASGDSNKATITIPRDSADTEFHVICEVTDNGKPALTSYRRVVFQVR